MTTLYFPAHLMRPANDNPVKTIRKPRKHCAPLRLDCSFETPRRKWTINNIFACNYPKNRNGCYCHTCARKNFGPRPVKLFLCSDHNFRCEKHRAEYIQEESM